MFLEKCILNSAANAGKIIQSVLKKSQFKIHEKKSIENMKIDI